MATKKPSENASADGAVAKPARAKEPKVSADDAARDARIAQRAYELFEARGGGHGEHVDDWLTAEREIDTPPATGRRRTT